MKTFLIFLFMIAGMSLASAQHSLQQAINMSELSLDEKLAQMLIVSGSRYCAEYTKLGVGGIFLREGKNASEYQAHIAQYQNSSRIQLLVAADFEGYWNPFASFFPSETFGEIQTAAEAHELGKTHGMLMRELGFTLDFSPVVEVRNTVWPGRSFTGSAEEIKAKIASYIQGVQEQGILATAKHYPGGSMLRDPHVWKTRQTITASDLGYFDEAIKADVKAVMVGHPVVQGALDSRGKQSSVSPEVIAHLRKNFSGLIITDSIDMLGLRWSYLFNKQKIYVDGVKAGNDMILDSSERGCSSALVKRGLSALKRAVKTGSIQQSQIDASVTRILKAKGYEVKR